MTNKLGINAISENELPAPLPNLINNITADGSGNTINAFVANQTIINISQSSSASPFLIDCSCCNLFVLKNKTYDGTCFSIPKSKVHFESVLGERVFSFPSIFARVSNGYLKSPDSTQQFFYGFVTRIEDEVHNLRIHFRRCATAPLLQSALIEAAKRNKITPIKGIDILDQTGWRIFSLDIQQALSECGCDMTIRG